MPEAGDGSEVEGGGEGWKSECLGNARWCSARPALGHSSRLAESCWCRLATAHAG